VAFLVRNPQTAEKITREGIHVTGTHGTFIAHARAESRSEALTGPFLCAMAAVKAFDLSPALLPVLKVLPADCPVLSLQNGMCIDELESLVGRDRAVGCVVGWGATLHAETEVELTSKAEIVIGCRSPGGQARLGPVRALLATALSVTVSRDIAADLYSKLIVNSCITSLGAISGRTFGWMLSRRLYRSVFIRIMREGMAAADAAGITVPPYAGKLDYYSFVRGDGLPSSLRRHVIVLFMGAKYRKLKSSSLQSLERGRPTEVDYFNGAIARIAREKRIGAPLNERLTLMVHEIESRARPIQPDNITWALLAETHKAQGHQAHKHR
jgi:2-dehydropantoate 2-reductase